MKVEYYKEFSRNLQRDMEFKVYGHAGKPCLVFPAQNGRFFDFENFQMVNSVANYIEKGKLQLFCVDSNDIESWSDTYGGQSYRIGRHELWFNYVCDEFVPQIIKIHNQTANEKYEGKIMTIGCSMGATHAVNFLLRRPDLFDATIALSGIYRASFFFPNYTDPQIYMNSPVDYMHNMSTDHPYLKLFRLSDIIICCGRGAWEDEMVKDSKTLQYEFERLQIPAWFDFWGNDVSHDWPWWRKQLPYFMSKLFE